MSRDLHTCHREPWALIRRAGDTEGKRLSTRMAYLTGSYVPRGQRQATEFVGYLMNNDMTGWSKTKRRIPFPDVIKQWRSQPSPADIRKIKGTLPVANAGTAPSAASVHSTCLANREETV